MINTWVHKQLDSITCMLLSPVTSPVCSGSPGFPRNHPLSRSRHIQAAGDRQSGEKQSGLGPVLLELRHRWTEKARLPPSSGSWRSPILFSSRHHPSHEISHKRAGKNGIAPPTLRQSSRSFPFPPLKPEAAGVSWASFCLRFSAHCHPLDCSESGLEGARGKKW